MDDKETIEGTQFTTIIQSFESAKQDTKSPPYILPINNANSLPKSLPNLPSNSFTIYPSLKSTLILSN